MTLTYWNNTVMAVHGIQVIEPGKPNHGVELTGGNLSLNQRRFVCEKANTMWFGRVEDARRRRTLVRCVDAVSQDSFHLPMGVIFVQPGQVLALVTVKFN